MRWWPLLLVMTGMVAGCATLRRKGDDAFESKDYVAAARFYDQALLEDPKDDEARAGRARARDAALAELLEEARLARARGSTTQAHDKLGQFFRLRRRWVMQTPPALVAPLKEQSSAAALETAQGVQHLLTDAPLAAEDALHSESTIFDEPELAAAVRELNADVKAAGQKRCERYLSDQGSNARPYWGWLVARYCRHFGRNVTVPALPDLASGIELAGTISGMSDASGSALAARLASALVGTPWYAPGAGERLAADLRGAYSAAYQHAPVELDVPWTERVAYTTTESRSVPHQVSQQQSEIYYVQVPYTVSQTETYSCGDSHSFRTCSRTRSVMRSRSESRTRWVTRWHTEYRPELQTVTRHRDVARVFRYTAERYEGRYTLASALTLHLPPDGAPLSVPLERREVVQALSSDVTFEPAGVEPTDGRPPGADQWLNRAVDPLVGDVKRALRQAWTTRFCAGAKFTVEEAARCLYGRQEVAGATEALRAVSGAEADALTALAVGP